MYYSVARPLISSGDVIAFSSDHFWASIVRIATKSSFDHVGISWVFHNRLFLLSAELTGVSLEALSSLAPFWWIKTNSKWTYEVEDLAFGLLGKPYSYLDALRVYLHQPPTNDADVCSSYVATILRELNLFLPIDKIFTPASLVEKLLKMDMEIHYIQPDLPIEGIPTDVPK